MTYLLRDHPLTEVDLDARTAVCGRCGPTGIFQKINPTSKVWACRQTKRRGSAELQARSRRRHWLRKLYDMSMEAWDEMVLAQSGLCAACDTPMTSPNVDHDHATGAVRELLCRGCNVAIGFLDDDPARARAIASYLERHGK